MLTGHAGDAYRLAMADRARSGVTPNHTGGVREFIVVDRWSVLFAAVAVLVLHLVTIGENDVFWLYPFLLGHAGLLSVALVVFDRGRLDASLVIVAASNWMVAVAVVVLFPWILPVMVLTVMLPLVLATPLFDRRILPWFLAGAIVLGVVGVLGVSRDDGGILDDVDDGIELGVIVAGLAGHSIPIGIIVRDTNRRFRDVAAEATELSDQVDRSRRRIVGAADAERSRIERDLHDGAQQQLIALGMDLRRLRSRLQRGDQVTEPELDDAVAAMESAMAELRTLAHGINPPLLELRGLPDALVAVARRAANPVRTQIEAVGRFDRSVESTVYFCCLEALQNADKHAPGAAVVVGLHVDHADRLCLEVRDDGPGFAVDSASAGHGLVNMGDRAGSLGGDLFVDGRGTGGTTVVVRIPVADARRHDETEVSA